MEEKYRFSVKSIVFPGIVWYIAIYQSKPALKIQYRVVAQMHSLRITIL